MPVDVARLEDRVAFSGSPMGDSAEIDLDADPTDATAELASEFDEAIGHELEHIDRLVNEAQDAIREIDEESLVEAGLIDQDEAADLWVRGGNVAALSGAHTIAGTGEIQANQNSPLDVALNEATSNTARGSDAAVGVATDGSYVVVWTGSSGATATEDDVYFQKFDNLGNPVGAAEMVNQTTTGFQNDASIVMQNDGRFIVVWESNETGTSDIYMRRFDANGNAVGNAINPSGDEFLVHQSETAGDQKNPDIAINDAGQFSIAWDGQGSGDGQGIFARSFHADGTPNSGVFRVNDSTAGNQENASLGIDATGASIYLWDDVSNSRIQGHKFDFDGVAAATPFSAPNAFGFSTKHASIDTREDGYSAVALSIDGPFISESIIVVVVNPDTSFLLDLFDLPYASDSNTNGLVSPSIQFHDDNSILISWEGPSDSGTVNDSQGVYYRTMEAVDLGNGFREAQTIGGETTLNETIAGGQRYVSLASVDQNNWVAVWSGNGPGDTNGVFARQFGDPIHIDLDVDDSVTVGQDFEASFTPGSGGVLISDTDATVTSQTGNLSSLTVSIDNRLDGAAEVLNVDTTGTAISQNYAAGVLTLSGLDSETNYRQVLRTLTYDNTLGSPNPAARTISFTATNDDAQTAVASTLVNVLSVNTDPQASNLTQTHTYAEGATAVPLHDIVVVDPDSGDQITAILTLAHSTTGSLSVGSGNGEIYDSGTGIWTITADVTTVNAALAAVEFTPVTNNLVHTAVATEIRDATGTAPLTGNITLYVDTPGNDAPYEVFNFAPVYFVENNDFLVASTTLYFNDVDNPPTDVTYTLDSTPTIGTLKLAGFGDLGVGDSFTQQNINDSLLLYAPDGDKIGSDIIDFSVSDGFSTLDVQFEVLVGNTIHRGSTGNVIGSRIFIVSDSPSSYTITTETSHGTLFRDTTGLGNLVALGVGDSFTQAEVDTGRVTYNHDGANTLDDLFVLTVTKTDSTTYVDSIEIRIEDWPELDLDADDSSGAIALDFDANYVPGSAAIRVTDTDTTVSDFSFSAFTSLEVALSGFLDGTDEEIRFAGEAFQSGNAHTIVVTAGSTQFDVSFDGSTFSITEDNSGTIPQADLVTLVESFRYRNLATAATSGTRDFEFRVQNPAGTDSPIATSSIAVGLVNIAPSIGTNDGLTVLEGSNNNVISTSQLNESDPDDDGIELTYTITTNVVNGTLRRGAIVLDANTADNTFTQADIDAGIVQFDHNGSETTIDGFQFSLADGGEDGAVPVTGSFQITVTPVNDAPTTSPVTLTSIPEDSGPRTITQAELLANAIDIEDDPLVATNLAIAAGNGSLVDNGDGSWDYTPSTDDDTGVSFSYTISDGIDIPGIATLDITPQNDPPTAAPVTLTSVPEDSGPRTITQAELLANATDVEGDSLVASALTISAGSGSLNDNGDGTWDYTPATDDDTSASFSYTISDGPNDIIGTATLDITPQNDSPTTSPVSLTAIVENSGPRTITQSELLANANDVDGDSLLANGLVVTAGSGSLVDNGDGTWNFTPAINDDTAVSFSYTIFDGTDIITGSASLDITPVNSAPTTANVVLNPISEDSGVRTITQTELLANASDVEGSPLVASGLLITSGNGVLVDNGDGTWDYTPAPNDDTAVGFNYSITDGTHSVAGTATLDIIPENDDPVAANDSYSVSEDGVLSTSFGLSDLLLNDGDIDGDGLGVRTTPVSAPTNGTLTLQSNGTFVYTPNTNYFGNDSFVYEVTDGNGGTAQATANITVNAENDAPSINLPSPIEVVEDNTVDFATLTNPILLSDVDAGSSVVELKINASNGFVSLPTGSAGLTFLVGDGFQDAQITILGTLTDLNSAVRGMTFEHAPGFLGNTTVDLELNDQGNTGPSGALSSLQQIHITVVEDTTIAIQDGGNVPTGDDSDGNDPVVEAQSPTTTINTIEGSEPSKVESTLDRRDDQLSIPNTPPPEVQPPRLQQVEELVSWYSDPRYRGAFGRYVPEFVTGTFEVAAGLGVHVFETESLFGSLDYLESEMMFSSQVADWTAKSGLVLTSGLSIGWVMWSVKGTYIVGSLLSTASPWTLIDPLPVLETAIRRKEETDEKQTAETKNESQRDKLESMLDK